MRELTRPLGGGLMLNLGAGATGGDWHAGGSPINVDLRITNPRSPFVQANALLLPFASASFDGALAKDIVEHVDDAHAATSEIRRILKPQATLVMTVPRAIPRAVWADPTHKRGFTRTAIVGLLTEQGFGIEAITRIGAIPGIGRLKLEAHLISLLRIPGFGHWFGTNWLVVAHAI